LAVLLAAFSDVHGNLGALGRVLAEIAAVGADVVVCAGDLVGYGPRPAAVVREVEAADCAAVVRGNHDEAAAGIRLTCRRAFATEQARVLGEAQLVWTRRRLDPTAVAALRSLPRRRRLCLGGREVLVVHGSPASVDEYVRVDTPRSRLEELAALAAADVVICGHTHVPLHRVAGGAHFVNPGAVGRPRDGDPRTGLALIRLGETIEVDFRRLAYDVESVCDDIVSGGLPRAFCDHLRSGRAD